MHHKDLLQLVFLEFENGHDMLNFSEINRKCNQIFRQHIKIEKNEKEYGMKKHQGQLHGISRKWRNDGKLWYEDNCYQHQLHGIYREWHKNGQLRYEINYYQDQLHGICRAWYQNGKLHYELNYHCGTKIEK